MVWSSYNLPKIAFHLPFYLLTFKKMDYKIISHWLNYSYLVLFSHRFLDPSTDSFFPALNQPEQYSMVKYTLVEFKWKKTKNYWKDLLTWKFNYLKFPHSYICKSGIAKTQRHTLITLYPWHEESASNLHPPLYISNVTISKRGNQSHKRRNKKNMVDKGKKEHVKITLW